MLNGDLNPVSFCPTQSPSQVMEMVMLPEEPSNIPSPLKIVIFKVKLRSLFNVTPPWAMILSPFANVRLRVIDLLCFGNCSGPRGHKLGLMTRTVLCHTNQRFRIGRHRGLQQLQKHLAGAVEALALAMDDANRAEQRRRNQPHGQEASLGDLGSHHASGHNADARAVPACAVRCCPGSSHCCGERGTPFRCFGRSRRDGTSRREIARASIQ